MYNRYIPQNGTYTRVVEQDGPEEGARRPAPHPPGPERGENGPRGSAGPPPGAARGAPGGGGRRPAPGPMGFGGLGDLLSGEKSPLNALFGGDKGGSNGILNVLRQEELDSGEILLILIILLLLVEGDNMDLVITLGLLLLLGLADDRKEEKQGG